ncbi:MAG: hypothetical protein M3457_10655 [Chloroflexota bacterium]|nr:hypothetical protein [Chloroflexota bacterium]
MGQSTDQIRQEIDHNRDDAARKIDQLQSQVVGTADDMRSNVQDTAEQVIGQVKGTVDQTVESVKQNLDLRQQIEERPLMALGVALVGGFLLGGLTGGGGKQQGGGYQYSGNNNAQYGEQRQYSSQQQSGGLSQGLRSAVQKTGIEDTISNAAAALLGSVTDQLKNTLDQNFPGFVDKMSTAQHSSGDFAEKSREAQSSSTPTSA